MKTHTRNCFSEKQRQILETLACNEIESEMDYNAAMAYFNSLSLSKTQQLMEVGGSWNPLDLELLQAMGKRLAMYRGVPDAVRGGISAALYQVGEIHPALSNVNHQFLE